MKRGPAAPASPVAPLADPGWLVGMNGGFDADWEHALAVEARTAGRPLLSVRVTGDEALVGPLWTAEGGAGCAGCAQVRQERRSEGGQPPPAVPAPPWLAAVVEAVPVDALRPGDLIAVSGTGVVARHRVPRAHGCAVCGTDAVATSTAAPPEPWRPARRPTEWAIPVREKAPFGLDPDRMREAMANPRFGPILGAHRDSFMPFAMVGVDILGGIARGYGRGTTYREAEAVGYLEAFERLAGYPNAVPLVTGVSRNELGELALDPAGLGGYTARQLADPMAKVRPYTPDTPMDWAWGHRLADGAPLLVPADVAFYQYKYPQDADGPRRRSYFHESSSGCALGSSYEEAALHGLMELAERDAFLRAWHRAAPLPAIDVDSVADPTVRLLVHAVRSRGYEPHLLATGDELAVPTVWVLALRHDGTMPASFSAAGAHPDPVAAVIAALWEVAQLVGSGLDWDPAQTEPLVDDPWLVRELLDHMRRYAHPELLPRVRRVLGGPSVTLDEAYPDWPGRLVRAADGDVTGALEFIADRYRRAGLPEIVLVDQSTVEHRDLGLCAVRAVVPGVLPMCFGQAQQRLLGLGRLAAAGADPADVPFDPHPFP